MTKMSFKKENSQDEIVKRTENLFNNLQKNASSVFYLAGNTITKTLINKASRSVFEKDRLFVDLYNQLENKKIKDYLEKLEIYWAQEIIVRCVKSN